MISGIDILLYGVIISLGGIASKLIENYRYYNNKRVEISTLNAIKEIYNVINNVLSKSGADRFYIFSTHNGSGQPSPAKKFKFSALLGSKIGYDTKYLYENVIPDEHYIDTLLNLIENKIVRYRTENIEKGLLRSIYELEEVKCSNIYYITTLETGTVYASIATKNENFCKNDEALFGLAINKISNMFDMHVKEKKLRYRIYKAFRKIIRWKKR